MKVAQNISKSCETRTNFLFGEFLVSKKLLSHRELAEALNEQRDQGGRLGEVLFRLKMLSNRDVTRTLAEYLSVEYFDFDDISKVDMDIARMIPEPIAKRFGLVAVGETDNKIIIAMSGQDKRIVL